MTRKFKSKYQAVKTMIDGHKFDSRKEAERYLYLKRLQDKGVISNLSCQTRYELIPAQREADTIGKRGGVHPGKVIEKAAYYYADFTYILDGRYVVEDVKSEITKTPVYRLKKKLMLYKYGIRIKEVE